MNILYYVPAISQDMGGIRQYAAALLRTISKDTQNKYFIYHEVNDPEIMQILVENPQLTQIKTKATNKNKWLVYLDKIQRATSIYYTKLGGKKAEHNLMEKVCKKYQIDIIHCPYQYLPESQKAKSICTMHDVQELHFPEYFTPEDRADRAVHFSRYIKNADQIVVSFQHVKNDIVKYFQKPADKVSVCPLDMDNLWIDKYDPGDVVPLTGTGISGDFVFYPANTWEHKNHLRLLEALVLLRDGSSDNIKLVCTGHKTTYYETDIKPFIENNHLQKQVIFTGVLNERMLYSLYQKCVGVVIPTLYEAGSFPLVESILLGVPVICSNVTSLPETISDIEFIFDPRNAYDISKKLKQLWDDADFRSRSIANCKKQAPYLRKTDAMNKIKSIYQTLES